MDAFGGAIGAGLTELAAGGDAGEIAGAVAQQGVLGTLPLFGVMVGLKSAIDLLRTWTGNSPREAVLGAFLANGDKSLGVNERTVEMIVCNAAVQMWHGNSTFKGHGPTVLQNPGEPVEAWAWADDFMLQLSDTLKKGGPNAILARMKIDATWQQNLDACRVLHAWAWDTKLPGYALPSLSNALVGNRFQQDGVMVLYKDPMPPPAEKTVVTGVHGKGGLFSRIGVPNKTLYIQKIADATPPSQQPIGEVFPGASAVGFEDGALPVELLPYLDELGPPSVDSPEASQWGFVKPASLTSSQGAAKPTSSEQQLVLVAVAAGAALLLALL